MGRDSATRGAEHKKKVTGDMSMSIFAEGKVIKGQRASSGDFP
jgi:hypothetical protein